MVKFNSVMLHMDLSVGAWRSRLDPYISRSAHFHMTSDSDKFESVHQSRFVELCDRDRSCL
jgi:hypothetical protein